MVTDPKTPKSKRNVSMPDFLCEELKEYLGRLYGLLPTDRIFHLTKSFLHHEMTRGAGKAGVKRIRIHDLRHSHVSLLISGSKEELSDILHQQIAAGQETEQIRKESEAIRQEVSELTAANFLLKEQTETLTEDKEKLLSENEKLEKQQKKLQQEINKMAQSKEVMERNIHAYDEDVKWQLAEPGALMSAKAYRDKKALPLVEKLKEVVKNLTIKCVQLTEQGRKLTVKVDGQQKQISHLTDKVMEQSDTIDRLQEKATDLGRLERHLGREQVQSIVERSKAIEQAERAIKRPKRAFEMSR